MSERYTQPIQVSLTPQLPPDAVTAALKLAQVLLQRAATSLSGYGYAQTSDAAKVGLVDGNMQRWDLTPLGQAILEAKLE